MSNKMECFYAAKEIIVSNINYENEAIDKLFKTAVDTAQTHGLNMPPVPTYKTVDLDDIFKLADQIEQYGWGGAQVPPLRGLLTE